jgi:S1-C subfamily serine protease
LINNIAQALEGKRQGDRLALTVIVKGREKQVELTLGAK